MPSPHASRPPENQILRRLSGDDLARLTPRLHVVSLDIGRVIFEPDEPIVHVYFPIDAMISLSAILDDGAAIEVATIGNEGMAGIPAFLDTGSLPFQAICQVAGDALRMSAADLRLLKDELPRLAFLLDRYTQALIVQIGQSAACNRTHSMVERCARWLLQTHDRVGEDEFNLTHEFLAEMLGVRRASVSVAAGELQKAGYIDYSRGRVTVVDRAGLESAACECYAVVRREYERLLGADTFDETGG